MSKNKGDVNFKVFYVHITRACFQCKLCEDN